MNTEKLVKNCFGQEIFVDPEDFIGAQIVKKGLYDRPGVYFMHTLLQEIASPIILDIGANIGNHLLPLLPFAEKAIAFEPQPDIFNRLARSIEKNNFKNCTLQNFGLAQEDKELLFYRNKEGNIGASSFVKEHVSGKQDTLSLIVKSGDNVIDSMKLPHLDFIKMDVEGFEVDVIKGLRNTISKNSPMIFMEWSAKSTKEQFIKENIWNSYLSDYKVLALVATHDVKHWRGRPFWKIRRVLAKLNRFKRWRLTEFNPKEDYSNILLYKDHHQKIINKLY